MRGRLRDDPDTDFWRDAVGGRHGSATRDGLAVCLDVVGREIRLVAGHVAS